MSANHTPCPRMTQRLDALDEALYRVTGFTTAMRLLSEDLQLVADTPENNAFWAMLGGIDAAVGECRTATDTLHRLSKGGA